MRHLRIRCLLAGALFAATALHAQSIDDERRALVRAKAQSAAADKRAAILEAQAAVQSNQAQAAQARAAAVASRIQAAESGIAAAEARIALIETLRTRQRARLLAQQQPAIRLVAALQMMSRRPPALALVQPGSLGDLVHVRAVLATLLPQLRARTAGLRAELATGRALRGDADRALRALGAGQQRLVTARAALVRLAAAYTVQSQAYAGSALIEQDRAIALGEEARDIVDLMSQINAGSQVRARLETLSGPLLRPDRPGDPRADPTGREAIVTAALPYRIPVLGTVVTGLGEVSDNGVRARGLTIATRAQAQVVAPARGRILFAGPYRGYGQIVIIDHGQRLTTLITNLASLDVRVGALVVQSSPIGRAASNRPTVTVELRRANVPIDITPFVAG